MRLQRILGHRPSPADLRAIATALEKQLRGLPNPAQAAALARHYHRSAALPNAEQGVPFALIAADDAARHYARRCALDCRGSRRWHDFGGRRC